MNKNRTSKLLILCSSFFLVLAFFYRLIITSDIPVAFSAAEAIMLHVLLFISTLGFIMASSINTQKQFRRNVIIALSFVFIASLASLKIDSDAEYFSAAYAQLSIPFILQPLLIIFMNLLKPVRHSD